MNASSRAASGGTSKRGPRRRIPLQVAGQGHLRFSTHAHNTFSPRYELRSYTRGLEAVGEWGGIKWGAWTRVRGEINLRVCSGTQLRSLDDEPKKPFYPRTLFTFFFFFFFQPKIFLYLLYRSTTSVLQPNTRPHNHAIYDTCLTRDARGTPMALVCYDEWQPALSTLPTLQNAGRVPFRSARCAASAPEQGLLALGGLDGSIGVYSWLAG